MKKHNFSQVHELAKAFLGEDFFNEMGQISSSPPSEPIADVYHSRNEVIVVINLPGMENIHTVDFQVEDTDLKIKGSFESPYEAYESSLMERKRGVFERTIPLRDKVFQKYSSARYKKGVLELRYRKQPG
ncbi:Hsp20/alpha crystallin family protein [Shimazuella alba]|jgi:HSP20 family protein|uniref:Hsp20 family protein n=1 Tax=Shimazuella alba TaxID=2690964 RepID=A0A6I4W471_9BACL|nr:Hsp20 family protein [Shimazuella alba]MXQ55574.1 Hsp20 family protein [Shimazuella alba]